MMANPIKSALFVDYDSFHRSLKAARDDIAELVAQRAATWVAAIESGQLVTPRAKDGARRRALVRRCYADPALLGSNRQLLISSGFEVIDCPPLEGRERNSAELHMVLDTVDALDHPTGYEEFILLSADADLTPMLLRLRAHDRSTVIFANDVTAANYKAIADAMIEEEAFLTLLAGKEQDEEGEAETDAASPPGDRSALETLARRVHAATNVPMFSPRTFADLFRALAQEIAEEGYHFQKTAENVTARLTEAGRNVNRRQVLFVVKGLALKGHVFSTTDTPERLAEVFRDQVLYLADSAGVELNDEDKALLPSWIVGRAPKPASSPAATPPKTEEDRSSKKPVLRRRPARPVRFTKDEAAESEPEADEAPPPTRSEPPARAAQPAASAPTSPAPAPEKKPDSGVRASTLRRIADLKASSAARLAALAKSSTSGAKPSILTSGRSTPNAKPAAATTRPAAKPADKQQAAKQRTDESSSATAGEPGNDALESSILAAIAQAVDVLVEDGSGNTTAGNAQAPAAEEALPEDAEPEVAKEPDEFPETAPEPEQSDGGEGDDIGDEIQRIIASYSRARQQN
jgi:NYN domain